MQTILLLAGLLSSLVYVTIDLLSAARYPGYDIAHMAISELSAIGAPAASASLWRILGPVYGALFLAFTVGDLRGAGENRWLRRAGWGMLAFVVWNLLWPIFPMNQRDAEKTTTDIMHLVVGGGSLILMLVIMGVGLPALGARFRRFSIASLAAVAAAGIGAFLYLPAMAAGGSTPWLGVVERVMLYGFLLWIAVLSAALMTRSRRPA